MRINEIVLKESDYAEDLVDTVKDILSLAMSKNVKKIKTEKFKSILAKQGYVLSTDELIQAVDASGYASSVDSNEIVPASELGADVNTADEVPTDVGAMANDQAMQDINSDLPA